MDGKRVKRILRQHVKTDQLLGVEAVPMAQRQKEAAPEPAAVVARAPAPAATPRPVYAAETAAIGAAPARQGLFAPPAGREPVAPQWTRSLTRDERLAVLGEMDVKEVRGCTRCDLCRSRTQTVFGEGDVETKLMFVGEGPGQTEDETGRPFVGRAGELLAKMIVAMGLTREQVYIANLVKCRPPNNRTPTPIEVDTCSTYLCRQISVIQPKVIVALGGPATKFLLQTQTGITALRGTWHSYLGLQPEWPAIPVMPTFHPAYLLRAYTPENRKKVWSDLQKVMGFLKE